MGRRNRVMKTSVIKNPDSSTKKQGTCCRKNGTNCPCGVDFGPWWIPWLLAAVTAGIRTRYVSAPENWWILHPDEIYQATEVAFSEVYGYGFRPYEYLPPPRNDSDVTSAGKQTLQSGMFALRSFMFPRIFSAVLHIAKFLQLDQNPLLICRWAGGIITSALPVPVYMFVLTVFRCRLMAALASLLTASNLPFAVFGTHTLVNSCSAPFLMLGICFCIPSEWRHDGIDSKITVGEASPKTMYNPDLNGNVESIKSDNGMLNSATKQEHFEKKQPDQAEYKTENSLNAIKIPKVHNLSDNANKKCMTLDRLSKNANENSIQLNPLVGGFILGMTCYIRVDNLLFASVLLCSLYLTNSGSLQVMFISIVNSFVGFIVSVTICAVDDGIVYGRAYLTPIQWFKFNILSGKAELLFKKDNFTNYISVLVPDSFSITLITYSVLVLLFSVYKFKYIYLLRKFCGMALSFILIFSAYSYVSHKEPRFLFNVLILQVILISYLCHLPVSFLKSFTRTKVVVLTYCIFLFLANAMNAYVHFPNLKDDNLSKWAPDDAIKSRDVNMCLDVIRRQNDVRGVFMNVSIFNTAGLAAIQHDVPLIIKLHNEYHFYDKVKANRLGNRSRIRVINDFSDFIHKSNKQYLFKLLNKDQTFNYALTSTEEEDLFRSLQFQTIRKCGSLALFTRRDMGTIKKPLTIKGTSAITLEYEANWLMTNGLFKKAAERTKESLRQDQTRVRPFQQLIVCYAKLNMWDKVRHYQEECFRRHGRNQCIKQQEKVVLDQEYSRFDVV